MSGGIWRYMSARTRRSVVFVWSALFVFSLGLQYLNLASPANVLAVHDDGVFQLDGNAEKADVGASGGDDWDSLGNADASVFITDGVPERSFIGGGSKDINDTDQWAHTLTNVPDKDDLLHAYAALYGDVLYFGADRYANNGDAALGFWFFKNGINVNPDGTFSPKHAVGDLFVVSHFTNGGSTSEIELFEWNGSGLTLKASGQNCTAAPAADAACAVANSLAKPAPWSYTPKSGPAGTFPPNSFFEGGLDLSDVYGGPPPCFAGFLVETRSSQETTAQQKDFVAGNFNTCEPPTIETQVRSAIPPFPPTSAINVGESVFDVATLTGDKGPVTGRVDFFRCGPETSAPDCTSGGAPAGSANVTGSGDVAVSAPFTAAKDDIGWFCYRAEYTPDAAASSYYTGGSHTNQTTECFEVIPANVTITKAAVNSSVSAGDQIAFILSWGNSGPGTATGVVVTDTLPTAAGLDWSIFNSAGSGSTCAISGPVGAEVLTCNVGTIPGNTAVHGTVTLVSPTTPASCGTVSNTGEITSVNDGSAQASASIVVNCPSLTITKEPDAGDPGSVINAGDDAVFSITVSNGGPGTAKNVDLDDTLPAGLTWVESPDKTECTITGGNVLHCDVGDLASGASFTVTVKATTSFAACTTYPNTAYADADNHAQVSDPGQIECRTATIDIEKTADGATTEVPVPTVDAGDPIGFTVTVTNDGTGDAYGVKVNDPLPAGVDWALDGGLPGWEITGPVGAEVLTFGGADGVTLAAGATTFAHVSAATSFEACATYDNKATVTTTNDGTDEASASIECQAPELSIVKEADKEFVNAGDDIGFTITVSNAGPGTAKSVTLDDPLPAGVTWTVDGGANEADCDPITNGTLTCDFGDLAAGESAEVHVSATTSAEVCEVYDNKAATASSTNHPDVVDGAVVTCQPPDVVVEKTADGATEEVPVPPVDAGKAVSFTITVWNEGPGLAKGVVLEDTLPAGVVWNVDSTVPADLASECTIEGDKLTCTIGELEAGEEHAVQIHLAGETDLEDCGSLVNLAEVTATNEAEADTGNNESRASVDVLCPDLGISKTADTGTVSAGDRIGFTVMIANNGEGTAFDVSVDDALPAGFDWEIDAANSDEGWEITGPVGTEVLIYGGADGVDLAAGATSSVHVVADTAYESCGLVPNVASIYLDGEFVADDSAAVTVECPALSIVKTADAETVNAGDPIGFTITVSNAGPGTAKSVTLDDPLPAGVTWTVDGGADAADCDPITNGTLTCDFGDLAAGESAEVHVTATTGAEACEVYDNKAATASSTNHPDVVDGAVITCQSSVVEITKTADDASVVAGDPIGFTVTVSNAGPGTAYGVKVNDPLPAGVTWSEDPDADGWEITGPAGAQVLTYGGASGVSLAAAGSVSVHISAQTSFTACATYDNTATVTTTNDGTDEASASIECQAPALSIVKTADAETVNAGDPIGFTITVSNAGPGTAKSVTLDDPLPAGVTWTVDGGADAADCDPITNGTLTCDFGDLAAGESAEVHVGATTSAEACEVYDNTATASSTNHPDVVDGAVITCQSSVVEITKTADDASVVAGDPIGFTVTVANTGAGAAYGVVVTDPLPSGFTWAEDPDVDGWTITGDPGSQALSFGPATLGAGLSSSVHVTAETDREDCGVVDNTATVTTTNDGSDEASASTTVVCPVLTLDKSNDAPIETIDLGDGNVIELPTVGEGDTVTYTLDYTLVDGPVTDGVLTDVLPVGVEYVAGSAQGNDEFSFVSYDAATRTLLWEAATVTKNGSVTYDVVVQDGAAELAQPLVNVAEISSKQTPPDGAESNVFVNPPPQALTPPPTDTFGEAPQGGSNVGFVLMLILLLLAGAAVLTGFVTPVPARIRNTREDGR